MCNGPPRPPRTQGFLRSPSFPLPNTPLSLRGRKGMSQDSACASENLSWTPPGPQHLDGLPRGTGEHRGAGVSNPALFPRVQHPEEVQKELVGCALEAPSPGDLRPSPGLRGVRRAPSFTHWARVYRVPVVCRHRAGPGDTWRGASPPEPPSAVATQTPTEGLVDTLPPTG